MANFPMKYILISLIISLTGCTPSLPDAKPVDGNHILKKVVNGIDFDNPGRGLADYPSDEAVDVPKSYALILLGAIEEAKAEHLK